jgi:hypothetical protein
MKQLSINDFKVGDAVELDEYLYIGKEYYRNHSKSLGKITRINKKSITFTYDYAESGFRLVHTKKLHCLKKI